MIDMKASKPASLFCTVVLALLVLSFSIWTSGAIPTRRSWSRSKSACCASFAM